jgi:teichoic acid transport system ATP-binding protein
MVARSPLRYLAPIALVVFTIVLIAVVASSGGGQSSSSNHKPKASSVSRAARTPARTTRRKYTVKAGDSLLAIAEKTGVPTDQLQRLNPDIDPQVLVPGQRLKLRP